MDIRFAVERDVPIILELIQELADYENLLAEVEATEEILKENLFIEQKAEVIIAEIDHKVIGFALFFSNFSTFLGKPGMYLEDLYIRPQYRNYGYGKQIISYLAWLAVDRDYGRLEWWCLDNNTSSIGFYNSLGAVSMDEWTVFRLSGQGLKDIAKLGEE
ncbi:GNAT family N-acetyltransferase [Lactococcus lactis]|uniref:GNAT family N-acetyltransferase n=1 Tax=Lactococcus lactis TaxID=1358 RepID=UPI002046B042|nr:GNAT family N-acetyltransferase [Lactococcus lactis]BDH85014.1 N-acetyltransferase [Lactococcus lactis]